jgi:hypothetical protein
VIRLECLPEDGTEKKMLGGDAASFHKVSRSAEKRGMGHSTQ